MWERRKLGKAGNLGPEREVAFSDFLSSMTALVMSASNVELKYRREYRENVDMVSK